MNRDEVLRALLRHRVVAILRGVTGEELLRLGDALYAGGLRLMELALAHDAPNAPARVCADIARLRTRLPADALVGAGTVLRVREARLAFQSSAQFLVSPNTDAAVIHAARRMGLASVPGAYTATEGAAALRAGADVIKLFPACCLPGEYVRHLRGPFPQARFLAAAGVTETNVAQAFADGYDAVAVSGPLCDPALLRAGDWTELRRRAAAFAEAARRPAV